MAEASPIDAVSIIQPTEERLGEQRALRFAPLRVGAVAFALYGIFLLGFFTHVSDPRDFIHMYSAPFQWSHTSSVIRLDPGYHFVSHRNADDGQWFYFIALDPVNAWHYIDQPAYRYTKVLYPLVARAVALGQSGLIPYTLILVNWLAIGIGTWILAAWLRRKGMSPWFALAYALYGGLFESFTHDLTEPLSYGLILLGVYLLDYGGRRRIIWAAVAFALAILARDKAAIFAAIFGVGLLFRQPRLPDLSWPRRIISNVPDTVVFLGIAGLPMLAYKIFLRYWLGNLGVQSAVQVAPLQGIALASNHPVYIWLQAVTVYVPSAICVAVAACALWKRMWRVEIFLLLVNIELAVVTLNPVYFGPDAWGVVRVSIATVVAAILCLPIFRQLTANQAWFAVCATGWCVVTPILAYGTAFGFS